MKNIIYIAIALAAVALLAGPACAGGFGAGVYGNGFGAFQGNCNQGFGAVGVYAQPQFAAPPVVVQPRVFVQPRGFRGVYRGNFGIRRGGIGFGFRLGW